MHARRHARRLHLIELQRYSVTVSRGIDDADLDESGGSDNHHQAFQGTLNERGAAKALWREFGPACWLALDREQGGAALPHVLRLSASLLADGTDDRALVVAHKSCLQDVLAMSHSTNVGSRPGESGRTAAELADRLWADNGVDAWKVLAKDAEVLVSRALAEIFAAGAKEWQYRHAMGKANLQRSSVFRASRSTSSNRRIVSSSSSGDHSGATGPVGN